MVKAPARRAFALVDCIVATVLLGVSLTVIIGLAGNALASQSTGGYAMTKRRLQPRSRRTGCRPERRQPVARRAFTLAELIVATIMMAILVGATYIAVSQTIASRDKSQARGDAMTRAAAAADLI